MTAVGQRGVYPVRLPAPIRVELFAGRWRSRADTTTTTATSSFLWLPNAQALLDLLDFYPGVYLKNLHYERRWLARVFLARLSLTGLERGKKDEIICGHARIFRPTLPTDSLPSPLGTARIVYGTEDGLDWGKSPLPRSF